MPKKNDILAMLLLFILIFFSSTPNLSEISGGQIEQTRGYTILSNDTTWTLKESPYIIDGNVLIEKGVKLKVEPGVVVKFNGDYYIQVEGKIQAEGTKTKMITFTSNKMNPAPGNWNSLKFMPNSDSGSTFEYCRVEYADTPLSINANDPFILPEIKNNIFDNNFNGIKIYYYFYASKLSSYDITTRIMDNKITNTTGTALYFTCYVNTDAWDVEDNYRVLIRNNFIKGNDRGLYIEGGGVDKEISGNIITRNGKGIDGNYFDIIGLVGKLNITRNVFTYNSEYAILDNFNSEKVSIENNTIAYNGNGTILETFRLIKINNNNIYNNTHFNVKNKMPKDMGDWDFSKTWWGTTNTTSIDKGIFDFKDDFNIGNVTYIPFSTKPNPNAPEISNENISIEEKDNSNGTEPNDNNKENNDPSTNNTKEPENGNNESNQSKPGDDENNNLKTGGGGGGYIIDTDGDGYPDDQENSSGSDPYNAKSTPVDLDGDGVINDKDSFPNDPAKWMEEKEFNLFFLIIIIIMFVLFTIGNVAYSRINNKNVLDHETRLTIYEFIRTHPGEHYGGLKDQLGINPGTLRHHLKSLQKTGRIKVRRDGKYKYFYTMDFNGKMSLTPVQKSIIGILSNNDGITTQDVAEKLGKERQTVSYHMNNLSEKGILVSEKESNRIFWHVNTEAFEKLNGKP